MFRASQSLQQLGRWQVRECTTAAACCALSPFGSLVVCLFFSARAHVFSRGTIEPRVRVVELRHSRTAPNASACSCAACSSRSASLVVPLRVPQDAVDALKRASELKPGDTAVKKALRKCEGRSHRKGAARAGGGGGVAACVHADRPRCLTMPLRRPHSQNLIHFYTPTPKAS